MAAGIPAVFKEVTKVGEELGAIRELVGSTTHADVAVIYDIENLLGNGRCTGT